MVFDVRIFCAFLYIALRLFFPLPSEVRWRVLIGGRFLLSTLFLQKDWSGPEDNLFPVHRFYVRLRSVVQVCLRVLSFELFQQWGNGLHGSMVLWWMAPMVTGMSGAFTWASTLWVGI
jgi:hypothetical protein